MKPKSHKSLHLNLDHRTSEDLFARMLELARVYCPEWTAGWPESLQELHDSQDVRLAMFKLFAKLTEHLLYSSNQIPLKHRYAFLDLMGTNQLPPSPARVPLTFTLAKGANLAYVPAKTKVASKENPDIIFETKKGLSVVNPGWKTSALVSVNPWHDRFTDHSPQLAKESGEFIIFGNDPHEQRFPHYLFLGDAVLFYFSKPVKLTLRLEGKGERFMDYFQHWFDAKGNELKPQLQMKDGVLEVTFQKLAPLELSKIDGQENYWLKIVPHYSIFPINAVSVDELPELTRVTGEITVAQLLPDLVTVGTLPVDPKAGFVVFGDKPKPGDSLYIACEEAFTKERAQITLSFTLQQELKQINMDSPLLQTDHLKNAGLLIEKILDGSRAIDSFLKEQIDDTLLDGLAEYDPTKTQMLEEFTQTLNSLLRKNSIYLKERFEGTRFRRRTRELLQKKPQGEREVQRLNRLLLEEAYSSEIAFHWEASIVWEYWDGEQWQPLEDAQLKDTTNHLTQSGTVSFVCPRLAPVKFAGKAKRWIRARLEEGHYGDPGGMVETKDMYEVLSEYSDRNEIIQLLNREGFSSAGTQFRFPEQTPPTVTALSLAYTYQEKPLPEIKSYNHFEYSDFAIGQNKVRPYFPITGERPSLYFGFAEEIAKGVPVSLYVVLAHHTFHGDHDERLVPFVPGQSPEELSYSSAARITRVIWKYYNGRGWQDLPVHNGDALFDGQEIIELIIPSDIQYTRIVGKKLYWIRAELGEGSWVDCPHVKNIYLNTVWAENSSTVKDEVLGSSNGKAHQKFTLAHTSILPGQKIQVREPAKPDKQERELLEAEEGVEAIEIRKKNSKEEIWVRWHEVDDFVLSTPLSRHYRIERGTGSIIFGDGNRGAIPPKGMRNVVAQEYHYGGGNEGNSKAGTLTSLVTAIASISAVTNHANATGGSAVENVEEAIERAPHTIKNRNRAVTAEDYAWLATSFSQQVARAKYIKSIPGDIKIAIIPNEDTQQPTPSNALLDAVERYLRKHTLFTLRDEVRVVEPAYHIIDLKITVRVLEVGVSGAVIEEGKSRFRQFLHPLKGGVKNHGWEFGERIYLADLAAGLDDIPGLDYIKEIVATQRHEQQTIASVSGLKKGWLSLPDDALPVAGDIHIVTTIGD